MGKVFSPEEVGAGHVPEPGAHQKAATFVLDSLLFEQVEPGLYSGIPGVVAALVYGSTTFKPRTRSDVDVLISYDPNQTGIALPAIRNVLEEAKRLYNVPIEAGVTYEGALRSPLEHGMDALFLRHLASIQERMPQWRRNRPVPDESLAQELNWAKVVEIAVSYCSNKARLFAWALTETDRSFGLYAMQRALELPSAIGRKVLAATLDPKDLPEAEVRTIVDKVWATEQVEEKLGNLVGKNDQAVIKLGRLAAINDRYSEVLGLALSGEMAIAEYTSWLDSHREPSCLLAHDISHRWTEVLRQRLVVTPSRPLAVPLRDYAIGMSGY